LRELIVNDFGEDHFFSHGGDRKSESGSRESLCTFMALKIGIKPSTVAALLNFGTQVGTLALRGLQQMEDMKMLSIRSIHQCNARLKEIKLRESIEKLMNIGKKNNFPEQALIEDLARTAANAIRDALNSLTENKSSKPQDIVIHGHKHEDKSQKPSGNDSSEDNGPETKTKTRAVKKEVLSSGRIKQVVRKVSEMKENLNRLQEEIQHQKLSVSRVKKIRKIRESIENVWIQIERFLQEITES
jgi:mRNA-degrading endonuclease RelE of RelBE toxin-antitoxin system